MHGRKTGHSQAQSLHGDCAKTGQGKQERNERRTQAMLDRKPELFFAAARHFEDYGYRNAWLIEVAACALARGKTMLPRDCLYLFEKENRLFGLEARIIRGLWDALHDRPPAEWEEELNEHYEGEEENM
jgi:hypothetical protein